MPTTSKVAKVERRGRIPVKRSSRDEEKGDESAGDKGAKLSDARDVF